MESYLTPEELNEMLKDEGVEMIGLDVKKNDDGGVVDIYFNIY